MNSRDQVIQHSDAGNIERNNFLEELSYRLSDLNDGMTTSDLHEYNLRFRVGDLIELPFRSSNAIARVEHILNTIRIIQVYVHRTSEVLYDERLSLLRSVFQNSTLFLRMFYAPQLRNTRLHRAGENRFQDRFREYLRSWNYSSPIQEIDPNDLEQVSRFNTYIFRINNLRLRFNPEFSNNVTQNSRVIGDNLPNEEKRTIQNQLGLMGQTRRSINLNARIVDLVSAFFQTICNICFVPEINMETEFPALLGRPSRVKIRLLLSVRMIRRDQVGAEAMPVEYNQRDEQTISVSRTIPQVSINSILPRQGEPRPIISPFFTDLFQNACNDLSSRFVYMEDNGPSQGSDIDLGWYLFDSFSLNVHIKAAEGGGCDTRRHVKVRSKYQYTIRSVSPRTTMNNCGISCILLFFEQISKNPFFANKCTPQMRQYMRKRPQTWRRDFLKRTDHFFLTPSDLFKICSFFKISLSIFDETLVCFHEFIHEKGFAHIKLLLEDQHYTLIQNITSEKTGLVETCGSCGKKILGTHVCVSECSVENIRAQQEQYKDKLCEEEYNFVASDGIFQDIMLSLIMNKTHVLLHAPAGYGKTYLIQKLVEQWTKDKCVFLVTASTGIAASLINGQTVHSALRLNVEKKSSKSFYNLMQALQFLVIDEISMLDSATFAKIDIKLREYRGNLLPFGGVQVILSGDCLQLPPISNKSQSYFFFQSYVFRKISSSLFVPQLKVNYRQTDDTSFQDILNHCRVGELTPSDVDLLRSRMVPPPENTPFFCPHRADVLRFNMEKLGKMPGEIITLQSVDDFSEKESNDFILPRSIDTKKNAFMIITRNIPEKKVCNGTFCLFEEYDEVRDIVSVKVDDRLVLLKRNREVLQNDGKKKIRFQFPLRLAWALTIHKCQGMTLSRACVDIGSKVFTSGQTYVALSRVRRLGDLYVHRFDPLKVSINPLAKKFANQLLQSESEKLFESSSDEMLCMNIHEHQQKFLEIEDKKTKKKMLNKVIFYDFETYDTQTNSGLQPYFNYMRYYQNDVLRGEKMYLLHENSTDVMTSTFDMIVQWMLEDDQRYESLSKRGSHAGRNARHAPIYLCAYNGSNFDFYWFFQYLLRSALYPSHFYSKQIFKGSSIIFMQIISSTSGRVMLQTHDICQILTSTLQNAVFDFCGARMKGVFPHRWVNKNGPRAILENRDSAIQLEWDDFFESQQEEVRIAIQGGELHMQCFRIYRELIKYGKQDVIILQQLYEQVNEITNELFSCNIFDFITASSLAFYGFMRHTPSRMLLRSQAKSIRLDILKLNREEENFVRSAIYGGRTLPRIHEWKSRDFDKQYNEIEDYYVYLDISGMYVSAMREYNYPYGIHQWLLYESDKVELEKFRKKLNSGKYTPNNLPLFIASVSIEFNKHDLEPSSPYHLPSDKNPKFTNLIWGVQDREEVTYSSVLLYQLCLRGARIRRIHKCMIWSKKCKMFEKWMDFTLSVKNSGGNAKRKFGKILGNATYGSMMKHDHQTVVRIIETNSQMDDFHKHYEWLDVIPIQRKLIVKGKPWNLSSDERLCSRPIFLSVFILDYTKWMVDNFVEKLMGPLRYNKRGILAQPLYGDTDSLVVHASQLPRVKEYLGKENGYWSDELLDDWNFEERRFGKIIEWIGSAPKSYGLQYRLPHKLDVQQKVKFKGIPRRGIEFEWEGETQTELTLPILRDCVVNGKSLEIRIKDRLKKHKFNLSRDEQLQGVFLFSLSSVNLRRTIFKSHNLRRKLLAIGEINQFIDDDIRKQFPGHYNNVTIPFQ